MSFNYLEVLVCAVIAVLVSFVSVKSIYPLYKALSVSLPSVSESVSDSFSSDFSFDSDIEILGLPLRFSDMLDIPSDLSF